MNKDAADKLAARLFRVMLPNKAITRADLDEVSAAFVEATAPSTPKPISQATTHPARPTPKK